MPNQHTQGSDNAQPNDELDSQISQTPNNLGISADGVNRSPYATPSQPPHEPSGLKAVTSGEANDGVPDEVQESVRLDRRAQQRLEHQHDEIDIESPAPSAQIAFSSDIHDLAFSPAQESRERAPVQIHAERPMGETPDGVEDKMQESDEQGGATITYLYRVVAVLPVNVQKAIHAVLHHIKVNAPPSDFQLFASFQAETLEPITTNLSNWATRYLPISTGLDRVYSAVIGQNTYIAGWRLVNGPAIQNAQNALASQLDSLVTIASNPEPIYATILPILPSIPAEQYAQAVGFLQHHFHANTWQISAIALQRRPIDSNDGWEVVKQVP